MIQEAQANIANMKRQINRISKEVTLIKKMLIYEGVINKKNRDCMEEPSERLKTDFKKVERPIRC